MQYLITFKKNLLTLLVLWSSVASAASVTIKGHVYDVDKSPITSEPISVKILSDFITKQGDVVKKGFTGTHGDFTLTIDVNEVSYVYLCLPQVERTLFVVPGKSYYVDIVAPIKELRNTHGPFAKDVRAAVIANSGPKELNYLIDTLDYACSQFLRLQLEKRKSKEEVENYFDGLEKNLKQRNATKYFHQYLKFKRLELTQFFYRTKPEVFVDRFLSGEKGLSKHIQKMHVFNNQMKGHMKYNLALYENSPFFNAVEKGNLNKCLNLIFEKGTVSREFQELLLLKGLYEIHSKGTFPLEKMLNLLDQIEQSAMFENHKLIAKHVKGKITHLKEAYPAPKFKLLTDKATVDPFQTNGKYLYLCFFNAWDKTFKNDLKNMDYLQGKYQEQLKIVCVSIDPDTVSLHKFLKRYYGDVAVYHYGFQNEILAQYQFDAYRMDRYETLSLSKYYLVDPEGIMVFSPAKGPGKKFQEEFNRIIAQ